jgi:two-component system sensor histidine kinase KdpD
MENRRSLGRGCTDWADLPLWCGPFNARSPAGAVQLLLTDDQDTPSLAERTHWQSLVRQIGLCVERERAAELARDAISASQGEAVRNAVLAGLSHDLRTPLAGIMGSASALREQHERLTPAQRDSLLLNLEHLARDMTRMADNTLHWARLGETPQLKLQWNSIEELVGVAIARARQRWSSPGIELRVGKDLPLVNVEAPLLMQVLANLLDNAARHGGAASGKILVQAGRCRDGVFIAVRDHGPGLPPGNPADLFQRFRRPAVTGDHTGAGLGLFLCQTIAQAHGGRLEARRCTPHPGAEFYLELPLTENNPEGVSL